MSQFLTRDQYAARMAERLQEWEHDLMNLRARGHEADATHEEFHRRIEEMEGYRARCAGELAEMQKADEGTWEDRMRGFEAADRDLSRSWKETVDGLPSKG